MAALQEKIVLGQAIVKFSRDSVFPEEDEVSALQIESSALSEALSTLVAAKLDLENEIRSISSESAPAVDVWIKHAKALQDDIEGCRSLASDTTRLAEISDALQHASKDAEDQVEFLLKEVNYSKQVGEALRATRRVWDLLDQAQQAAVERNILTALHILSKAWDIIETIPANVSTRAVRLLNYRAFSLRASIHEDFGAVWNALVDVNIDAGTLTIQNNLEADAMDINSAITTMKAYKELDDRIRHFSDQFETVIIRPRIELKLGNLSSIEIRGNTIRTTVAHGDLTIKSLLLDLERTVVFLNQHLPVEFTRPLSSFLMPKLCSKIKKTWLDSAVPASLDDMTAFRKAIALVQVFANSLRTLHWTGADELQEWVVSAPRTWLTKRRETSLDWIRNQIALGTGITRKVNRVETQAISRSEGQLIPANLNGNENDWDAAWSDEEQDDDEGEKIHKIQSKDASHDGPNSGIPSAPPRDSSLSDSQDDDEAEAWGWGDEDDPLEPEAEQGENGINKAATMVPVQIKGSEAVRKVTLTEKYTISSMPDPVLKTITSILDDATTLTQEINEQNPVAAAAAGLFALPTLILAMYRAVSPYYYTVTPGGNMYLYNDAMWLAEQLREFAAGWTTREDLNPRAHGKVKLDSDIQALERFGRRAYANEMSTQRTILNDLLGGSQNFLQQDGQTPTDDDIAIESVVSHVKGLSSEWKQILSKSAWAQAIGSLLSSVAKKIILDIGDLTSLGADEAYRVANLISKIVKLDDLFLPEDQNQPQIPVTSQYVPNWLKLHFLSEVLQSDLKDLKYLWFESDLSLYFMAQEVIDLIELSFENNFRTREAISSIRDNPQPRGMSAENL